MINGTFLAILLLLVYSCSSENQEGAVDPPLALPVMTISSGTQKLYHDYPASIEGTANVEIRPQVEGILDAVLVDEGAKVKKGQVLFKINDRPYRERLNEALANLHAAQAALENTQLEVEKKTRLVDHKVLADFQLKAALAAENVAKANLEQANAGLASARINLDYTLVRATHGRLYRSLA